MLWAVDVLHLGDCIGADTQAYTEAIRLGVKTIGHPPTNPQKRSFLTYDEERPAKPYLARNLDIATEGEDGVIATPQEFVEVLRSGTWATVRYARKLGRKVYIIRPDGSVA